MQVGLERAVALGGWAAICTNGNGDRAGGGVQGGGERAARAVASRTVLHAQAAGVHGGDAAAALAATAPGLQAPAPPGLHEPTRVRHNTGSGVECHGLGTGWGGTRARAGVHGRGVRAENNHKSKQLQQWMVAVVAQQ